MTESSKTIFRSRHDRDYTVIHNSLLNNPNLSGKAKWILLYLLSKPADWKTRVSDIVAHGTDGRNAVLSGIKELKEAGYLRKVRVTCPDTGKVLYWETHVFDCPQSDPAGPPVQPKDDSSAPTPDDENPHSGNPHSGNPQCGKSDTTKYLSVQSTHQNKTTTTTKQRGGGGGDGLTSLEQSQWEYAQRLADIARGSGYIGSNGQLCEYRLTKPLVQACIGHTEESVAQAVMATWEFMDCQRAKGQIIRNPQGVLMRALADWQQPSADYQARHNAAAKAQQEARQWARLAEQCGMIGQVQFDWDGWRCVDAQGQQRHLLYGQLPESLDHLTLGELQGYAQGFTA